MGKVEAKGEEKEKMVEGEKKDFSRKEDGPITVVLKVEMHCKGCAQKARRSVKGFKGVQGVASDITESKLTVIGKVDPVQLRNHLESKMHKKVEIISPAIAVKKEKESSKADGNEGAKDQKPDQGKEQKKADDKKPNEPSVTSVTLKIRLHCHGCTERIRKQINKIKGVESVSFDSEKDLVTVKGSMDVTTLPGFLMAKLNRGVEIVNPKKDGDGDKEKSEKKKGSEGQDAAKTATAAVAPMDYYRSFGYPHHSEIVVGPQLFSDENPNACSIM